MEELNLVGVFSLKFNDIFKLVELGTRDLPSGSKIVGVTQPEDVDQHMFHLEQFIDGEKYVIPFILTSLGLEQAISRGIDIYFGEPAVKEIKFKKLTIDGSVEITFEAKNYEHS